MNLHDVVDQLKALLPNILGLALVTGMLASALLAVRTSRRGVAPADSHFVLALAVAGAGVLMLVGGLARAATGLMLLGDRVTSRGLVIALGAAWALGAGLLVTRLLAGWIGSSAAIWLGRRPDERHQRVLRSAAVHVGLRRVPRVAFSGRCASPVAVGALRPAVLLPDDLWDADEETIRSVVVHELAHVRRRDCLVELGVQIVGSLLWWNPVFWLVARDLRLMREMVCDEIVLFGGARTGAYARLLARYAQSQAPLGPGLAVVGMAARSTLSQRLRVMAGDDLHGWPGGERVMPRYLPNVLTNLDTAMFVAMVIATFSAVDVLLVFAAQEAGAVVAL